MKPLQIMLQMTILFTLADILVAEAPLNKGL
jgi:hypothetical protein